MINTKKYLKNLEIAIKNLDINKIQKIENLILKTIKNKKNILVCGNGGAASISNHLLCDFNKGIKISSKGKLKPKVLSLSNNLEIITAISNDINYNEIFLHQLENYYSKGDLVITFSCSGTSANVVKVMRYCKFNKIPLISFTGFATKKYQQLSTLNVNIGIKNYGICEDMFQIIMHIISQNLRIKYFRKKNKYKAVL